VEVLVEWAEWEVWEVWEGSEQHFSFSSTESARSPRKNNRYYSLLTTIYPSPCMHRYHIVIVFPIQSPPLLSEINCYAPSFIDGTQKLNGDGPVESGAIVCLSRPSVIDMVSDSEQNG
jgi:hypothetical protein